MIKSSILWLVAELSKLLIPIKNLEGLKALKKSPLSLVAMLVVATCSVLYFFSAEDQQAATPQPQTTQICQVTSIEPVDTSTHSSIEDLPHVLKTNMRIRANKERIQQLQKENAILVTNKPYLRLFDSFSIDLRKNFERVNTSLGDAAWTAIQTGNKEFDRRIVIGAHVYCFRFFMPKEKCYKNYPQITMSIMDKAEFQQVCQSPETALDSAYFEFEATIKSVLLTRQEEFIIAFDTARQVAKVHKDKYSSKWNSNQLKDEYTISELSRMTKDIVQEIIYHEMKAQDPSLALND